LEYELKPKYSVSTMPKTFRKHTDIQFTQCREITMWVSVELTDLKTKEAL